VCQACWTTRADGAANKLTNFGRNVGKGQRRRRTFRLLMEVHECQPSYGQSAADWGHQRPRTYVRAEAERTEGEWKSKFGKGGNLVQPAFRCASMQLTDSITRKMTLKGCTPACRSQGHHSPMSRMVANVSAIAWLYIRRLERTLALSTKYAMGWDTFRRSKLPRSRPFLNSAIVFWVTAGSHR